MFETVFIFGYIMFLAISYCPGPALIEGFLSNKVFLIPVELNGANFYKFLSHFY